PHIMNLKKIMVVLCLAWVGSFFLAGAQDAEYEAFLKQQEQQFKQFMESKAKAEQAELAASGDLENPEVLKATIQQLEQRLEVYDQPTAANEKPQLQRNLDYVWVVTAAILVFFMQVGFCMLEMGLVRSKNCINVAMKNVIDFSAVAISYLLFGFYFMYGMSSDGGGGFIGSGSFSLWTEPGDSPVWTFWFFQVVFAATCCTIASGAMAERTKFVGYLIYTVILSGLIYPVFGHWAWGSLGGDFGFGGASGWLEDLGFHDFAGSTVVHGIGGATALAGIIILGPRVGRFGPNGEPRYIPGHSLPLAAFGTLVLWVGWFGFNAGSSVEGSAELGRVCANTAVAGGAGCIVAMAFFWIIRGIPNVLVALNGILGGLVAVTACCDVVNPLHSLIIGAIAGVVSTAGAILLEKMGLDDVVGAVPVHLFNGMWGTIAVAIFNENGFKVNALGIQAFGTIAICLGAFGIALVLFKVIDTLVGLRANDDDQEDGLDFAEHSANAYPDFQTTER
ncbi:MAG: ammonium transporter, partial [Verrucomicrobiota bacterium]